MTLLLPPRVRFAGQALPTSLARALGRADPMAPAEAGERAQLLRHFDLLPRGWPIAALARQVDLGDAAQAAWLRADPAWLRPDINGVRLLACGEALQLTQQDVDMLLPALRPLFGDAGFPIDAPVPSRWYLRLPREARLPLFVEPGDALGADLFDCLPQDGDGATGASRRWRALLSEAQVLLHNHPWNATRAAAGRPPVNSVWFWGGGALPDQVVTTHRSVRSDEVTLRALASAAKVAVEPIGATFAPPVDDCLVDLRSSHDIDALARDWLLPAIVALHAGILLEVVLDFADGGRLRIARGQRWRFWCRPLAALEPVSAVPASGPRPA